MKEEILFFCCIVICLLRLHQSLVNIRISWIIQFYYASFLTPPQPVAIAKIYYPSQSSVMQPQSGLWEIFVRRHVASKSIIPRIIKNFETLSTFYCDWQVKEMSYSINKPLIKWRYIYIFLNINTCNTSKNSLQITNSICVMRNNSEIITNASTNVFGLTNNLLNDRPTVFIQGREMFAMFEDNVFAWQTRKHGKMPWR